jgi:glycosyltransferase involved in cell wall biosynthesis
MRNASPPAVTIVTPTRNRRQLLTDTMDSVVEQSLADWEHIIVDDGSDDDTSNEVARRSVRDPRIRYMQRAGKKTGANVCRNIGLREARAELIVFLDSDDLLRPDSLRRRVEVMRNNRDLDFAVFQAAVFENRRDDLGMIYHPQTPGDDLLRFLSLECVWQTTGPIWRRGFLERIGGFDEDLLSMQDLEMHVRALTAGGTYLILRDLDHDIRGRMDSTRTSARHFVDPEYIKSAQRTVGLLFDSVKRAELLTWSRRRAILGLYFNLAESWAHIGRPEEGLRAWGEGCRACGASRWLSICGFGLLNLLRTNASLSGPARLINKWKGWTRLRPEPIAINSRADGVARTAS